ncbi:MAG: DDE-type integrase/transposase/recombinase [Candidatus Thermoplasmatota archaeon]
MTIVQTGVSPVQEVSVKTKRSRSMSLQHAVEKGLTPPTLTACVQAYRKGWRHGQALPPALRKLALEMVASGVRPGEVAKKVGATYECVRLWVRDARASGELPPASGNTSAPPDAGPAASPQPAPAAQVSGGPTTPPVVGTTSGPGSSDQGSSAGQGAVPTCDVACGLSAVEQAAILDLKNRHLSMGPAQIRAQLKRFKGWRVSVRAIGRLLKKHGFELVHVGSRPKDEELHRFEAPHRNALWQMDFVVLRIGPEQVSLLLVIDDFSRYCVAHELMSEPTSEAVVGVLKHAIRQHGKPEGVYTDRGGPFLAWRNPSSMERFLEDELIEHHVGTSYHPQGRGKVEALAATVQRELWNVVHFESVDRARGRLVEFFRWYNHDRAHMGLDGLTPADRYFGRWEQVKAQVDAASRGRQLALSGCHPGRLTEEVPGTGGPVEVLRLVCVEDRLELRFCGHRVDLGRVQP